MNLRQFDPHRFWISFQFFRYKVFYFLRYHNTNNGILIVYFLWIFVVANSKFAFSENFIFLIDLIKILEKIVESSIFLVTRDLVQMMANCELHYVIKF